RIGHPTGADGQTRRGRPDRQGRGPAPGRPDLRRVRPDRHRYRRHRPRRMARCRIPRLRRLHRSGRGPRHRLPLRPRPGHPPPTALLVGPGRGAQMGVLIKGPEVLESTRKVDTVVLDKTGTVTTGKMTLVEAITEPGVDRTELLRLAGALEDASEHPIAQAIAKGAVQ